MAQDAVERGRRLHHRQAAARRSGARRGAGPQPARRGCRRSTSPRRRASSCICSRGSPARKHSGDRHARRLFHDLARPRPARRTAGSSRSNDPAHAEVARPNLAGAGVADKVDLRVGPALDALPLLARGRRPVRLRLHRRRQAQQCLLSALGAETFAPWRRHRGRQCRAPRRDPRRRSADPGHRGHAPHVRHRQPGKALERHRAADRRRQGLGRLCLRPGRTGLSRQPFRRQISILSAAA